MTKLTIRNYALIRELELTPATGLNVITGETGAGKSIMLGALGLLLGNRADSKVLWDDAEKCITEGEFDISSYRLQSLFKREELDYDPTTIIRREISASGKSRAFINDTPVTLDLLRKVASRLMDIHSQHETLELGTHTFQLSLVDAFAGNEKIAEQFSEAWTQWQSLQKEFDGLMAEAKALKDEADFVMFQLEELVKVRLEEGEQERLESELKVQEHAEEIKKRLATVVGILSQSEPSVSQALAEAKAQLNAIAGYSSSFAQLHQRLESVRIELDDLAAEIENEQDSIEFDPLRLEESRNRLSLLYQLMHKHRLPGVSDLIRLQEELQARSDKTSNLDETLASLEKKTAAARSALLAIGETLSKSRQKAFQPLCNQLKSLLKELGIPDAQVTFEHETVAPQVSGCDNIELLFSANKGIAPRPIEQVASGGEFARLMFAIKYVMAEKTHMPTLILDEIDTGVSGEIALKLGDLMIEMGKRHQVIAITHLPQIAARGGRHYFVYKDNSQKKTISHIRPLENRERVEEIAKMIGGASPSKTALDSARELLAGRPL